MKNLFKILFLLLFAVVKPAFAQQDVYTQKSLAGALSDKVNSIDVGSLIVDAKKDKHLLKYLKRFLRLNYLKIINCDSLPVGIFAIKFLNHIEIKGLNYMPNGAYENFKRLTILEIDSSNIEDLPSDFAKIPVLKEIHIKNSNLKVFPDALTKMLSLETINLSDNKIATIPASIGNMKLLENLILFSNQITTLPKEIEQTKSLKALSLTDNINLEKLPIELAKLKYLDFLDVVGTKITPADRIEFKKKCFNKNILIPRY